MHPQLSQNHPVLQISDAKVVWQGNVNKINTHGKFQPRYLLVTSSAIFMFKTKTFPRSYQLVRILPIASLRKLTLTPSDLTIDSVKHSLTLQNQEATQLCSIIYTLHETVFPDHKMNFSFDDSLREKLEETIFIYEPQSILGERFLSYCTDLDTKFTYEDVKEVYQYLKESNGTFYIKNEMIDSPLFTALTKTAAYSSDITSLIIEHANFAKACKMFIPVCKDNSSIKHVIFKNVDFKGTGSILYDAFANGCIFSANQFTFLDCDMTTSDITCILDFFQIYTHEVNKVVFEKCAFSQDSIMDTLQSIFVSPCFGRLRSLIFLSPKCDSFIDAALILFSSSWMIEEQCLRELSLINCGLDLSKLLPQIMQYETGLVRLNLSENYFSQPLTFKVQKSFHDIDELILQNVNFPDTTFTEFLKVLSTSDPSPSLLDLSDPKIMSCDLAGVYASLQQINLPELKTLCWKGIEISNSRRLQSFLDFVCSMPLIKELDITDCLKDLHSNADDIINVINHKHIEKIGFGGCEDDDKLHVFMNKLSNCPSLKSISINNVKLTSEAIKPLKFLIPQLEEFRLDGCTSTSTGDLEDLCRTVLTSDNIKKASFPDLFQKGALSSVPQNKRTEKIRIIEDLKNKYENKFCNDEEEDLSDRQHKILRSATKRGEALLAEMTMDSELQALLSCCMNGSVRNVLLDSYMTSVSQLPIDLCF